MVGTAGALAPAMLKPWGESVFVPAMICQVYLLVTEFYVAVLL